MSFANFDRQRMKRHDVSEEGVPQIVCKSEIFATTVYGHAYNLHSELVAKIKNGLQINLFYRRDAKSLKNIGNPTIQQTNIE